MNSLAAIMASALEQQMARWKPGTFDMQAEMTELTLNVACRALLGVDPDVDDLGQTIRTEFEALLGWLAAHLANPALPPAWVPTPATRSMKQAKANLQAAIHQLMQERRASGTDTDDVLGRLIRSQRDTGAPDDADIVDECIGFLFAGHETTASTLTFAFYALATHQQVQTQVAAEGNTINLSSPTLHDDLSLLDATDAAVEETLRLYPAGVAIARTAKKTTDINGHRVRRGTMVMIAVHGIQRHPSVWERPDQFDPDRPTPPAELGLRNSFLAFGLGPRRCLGARFARTEMRLVLATICSRWNLTYDQPSPPVTEVAPSLRVAGTLPLSIKAATDQSGSDLGSGR